MRNSEICSRAGVFNKILKFWCCIFVIPAKIWRADTFIPSDVDYRSISHDFFTNVHPLKSYWPCLMDYHYGDIKETQFFLYYPMIHFWVAVLQPRWHSTSKGNNNNQFLKNHRVHINHLFHDYSDQTPCIKHNRHANSHK